jgi:hypothetical protein
MLDGRGRFTETANPSARSFFSSTGKNGIFFRDVVKVDNEKLPLEKHYFT